MPLKEPPFVTVPGIPPLDKANAVIETRPLSRHRVRWLVVRWLQRLGHLL